MLTWTEFSQRKHPLLEKKRVICSEQRRPRHRYLWSCRFLVMSQKWELLSDCRCPNSMPEFGPGGLQVNLPCNNGLRCRHIEGWRPSSQVIKYHIMWTLSSIFSNIHISFKNILLRFAEIAVPCKNRTEIASKNLTFFRMRWIIQKKSRRLPWIKEPSCSAP